MQNCHCSDRESSHHHHRRRPSVTRLAGPRHARRRAPKLTGSLPSLLDLITKKGFRKFPFLLSATRRPPRSCSSDCDCVIHDLRCQQQLGQPMARNAWAARSFAAAAALHAGGEVVTTAWPWSSGAILWLQRNDALH